MCVCVWHPERLVRLRGGMLDDCAVTASVRGGDGSSRTLKRNTERAPFYTVQR